MRRAVTVMALLVALALGACGKDPRDSAITDIEKRAEQRRKDIAASERKLSKDVAAERKRLRHEADLLEQGQTETTTTPTTTEPGTTDQTGGAAAP